MWLYRRIGLLDGGISWRGGSSPPTDELFFQGVCADGLNRSFVAERDNGIHAHGSTRGNVARQQRYADQQNRDAAESERVGRLHSIQQAGDEFC